MKEHSVANSYAVGSSEEAESAYDDWSDDYEADLFKAGYRIPGHISAVFTRFVPLDANPILDAGCGGGLQAEGLALLGYSGFSGIDFSDGMLRIANAKGIYDSLTRMVLGEPLDLPSNHFKAVLCAGCITPGHAPPHAFDELVRVCQSGSPLIFSLRDDAGQDPAYPAAVQRLTEAGAWKPIFSTDSFYSLPYGEPDVTHRIHVFEAL